MSKQLPDSVLMQEKVSEFLNSGQRNAWTTPNYGMAVYFRKSLRHYDRTLGLRPNSYGKHHNCLDLATVDIDEDYQGKGYLSFLLVEALDLAKSHNLDYVMIENCQPQLALYMHNRGWKNDPTNPFDQTYWVSRKEFEPAADELLRHLSAKFGPSYIVQATSARFDPKQIPNSPEEGSGESNLTGRSSLRFGHKSLI